MSRCGHERSDQADKEIFTHTFRPAPFPSPGQVGQGTGSDETLSPLCCGCSGRLNFVHTVSQRLLPASVARSACMGRLLRLWRTRLCPGLWISLLRPVGPGSVCTEGHELSDSARLQLCRSNSTGYRIESRACPRDDIPCSHKLCSTNDISNSISIRTSGSRCIQSRLRKSAACPDNDSARARTLSRHTWHGLRARSSAVWNNVGRACCGTAHPARSEFGQSCPRHRHHGRSRRSRAVVCAGLSEQLYSECPAQTCVLRCYAASCPRLPVVGAIAARPSSKSRESTDGAVPDRAQRRPPLFGRHTGIWV